MRKVGREELLSREVHMAHRPVRDKGRCVLLFPNEYGVGMASLAVHTLYSLLNDADMVCERAFMPGQGKPQDVRSLESQSPLAAYDFVLISSSFELDWLNIPALLEAGGVPALREERGDRHPMVFIGGPAVTGNPAPMMDLVDVMVLGEVEPIAADFVATLRDSETKEEVLERLGRLEGVWTPGQDMPHVERLFAPDINVFSTESAILTPYAEFGERFLVEVGRGCGRGCRFCMARSIYHPNRVRRPEMLLGRVAAAMPYTRNVGLVGAAVSDYPWTDELFGGLREMGASVSVSSMRAESVTETMLEVLAGSANETLTLAPEAGTETLRAAIGKGMPDDELLRVMRLGVKAGMRKYKLYFMVGLPGERQEDLEGIARLVGWLKDAVPEAMLSVTVSPFVPKPHTDFADEVMLPEAELARRLDGVTKGVKALGIREVGGESPRSAVAQAVLSRGGGELGRVIVEASRAGGGVAKLKAAVKRAGGEWG